MNGGTYKYLHKDDNLWNLTKKQLLNKIKKFEKKKKKKSNMKISN